MTRLLATVLFWSTLLGVTLAGEPEVYNWLNYAPPPGFGKTPWGFRRETLDPLFGSKQPHLVHGAVIFKDGDPLKPQPEKAIEFVLTTASGPLGKYYGNVVVLDIEYEDYENLDRNWNPMRPWALVEPNALHRLIWYVQTVKAGLPGYRVGLWGLIPSSQPRQIHNQNPEMRSRWFRWCRDVAPLGKTVDFTSPDFYWVLKEGDPEFYTHNQREESIALVAMVSHELYGRPCYPWIWPECYRRFQTDPWPDNAERRLARQMTEADMRNTVGACLKYADGFMLWSQRLVSAPGPFGDNHVPWRWDDPWITVLMEGQKWLSE